MGFFLLIGGILISIVSGILIEREKKEEIGKEIQSR